MSKKKNKNATAPIPQTDVIRKHSDFGNFLMGAQLLEISEGYIRVKKDNKIFNFALTDEGSWSDWWEVFAHMKYQKNAADNPIITNYEYTVTEGSGTISIHKLTFFGLNKEIAEISAKFHNDSDWDYGCTVTAVCTEKRKIKQLNIFTT